MNRMSSIAYVSAGVSSALLKEGSRMRSIRRSQSNHCPDVACIRRQPHDLRFDEHRDLSSPAARGTPVIIGAATAFGWK